MTKWEAFLLYEHDNPAYDDLSQANLQDNFEIAWEAGEFNETTDGECSK